jgi:hypothetical protein
LRNALVGSPLARFLRLRTILRALAPPGQPPPRRALLPAWLRSPRALLPSRSRRDPANLLRVALAPAHRCLFPWGRGLLPLDPAAAAASSSSWAGEVTCRGRRGHLPRDTAARLRLLLPGGRELLLLARRFHILLGGRDILARDPADAAATASPAGVTSFSLSARSSSNGCSGPPHDLHRHS